MFFLDIPTAPPQNTPIVLAQADTVAGAIPPADYILKGCQETFHGPIARSSFSAGDPDIMLKNYFGSIGYDIDLAAIKTTLLQDTTHGKITSVINSKGRPWYRYDPAPGFHGDDKAVFMAEYAGKRYKIVLQIKVTENFNENDPQCPDNLPVLIKVSKPSSGASGYGSGYNLASVSVSYQPNPAFERDTAKARRPSTLR